MIADQRGERAGSLIVGGVCLENHSRYRHDAPAQQRGLERLIIDDLVMIELDAWLDDEADDSIPGILETAVGKC